MRRWVFLTLGVLIAAVGIHYLNQPAGTAATPGITAIPLMGNDGTIRPGGQIELETSGSERASYDKDAPDDEDNVVWKRDAAGTVTAKFKKHFDCPTYTANSMTWIDPHPDHIDLCYHIIESTDINNQMFNGPCPQDIVVNYKIDNVPTDRDPVFVANDHCPNPKH